MAKKVKDTCCYNAHFGPNANYDFKQFAPKTPMGSKSFANLPPDAMIMPLSGKWDMRGGIRNSPVTSIDEISDVDENR